MPSEHRPLHRPLWRDAGARRGCEARYLRVQGGVSSGSVSGGDWWVDRAVFVAVSDSQGFRERNHAMGREIEPQQGARPIGRIAPAFGAITASVLVLQGCVNVGPDYEEPEIETPDAWHQALAEGMAAGTPDLVRWWESLDDPTLATLIQRAADGNPTLKETVARIEEAQAFRQVAAGERFPDVNLGGGISRSRTSDVLIPPTVGFSRYNTFYEYGPNVAWEADFWGRIRQSIEAADAEVESSLESYRDALVLLYAQVALTYTDVRTLQERISFTEGNIQTQRDALGLVQDRNRAGLASDLEVHQAELNLYRTEAFLPSLRAALTASINQLSILLGDSPGALHAQMSASADIPRPDSDLLVGVPGDLIRRRPDIRAVERALAAQTARIGVATADLYPRFTIQGDFTILATDTDDLTDWQDRRWSIGGFFDWNLFDGGRVRGVIDIEDARTEQLLYRYEQTVLSALEEVETAMSDFTQEQQRRRALDQSATAAQRSVELVLILYRTGLTDFQNVLDMQRSLFEQQDQFADSDGKVTRDLIRIYAALGGGWDPEDNPLDE